uniref:Putative microtubule associated protein xmap215 n=1 Tax=Schistosoma mansoni TaxID=6183 RepID=A0A3Q0KG40_SCHMA
MSSEDDWSKLPTLSKVQHKLWNARVAGYEEAFKIFSTETSGKSPVFNEYVGLMKKFVTDSHAGAQEKALDAVLAYIETAAAATKCAGDICSGIISKCLGSTRVKTKDKSIECLLMLIEIERHELVIEELIKGLSTKNPKVVVGSLQTLREALNLFGPTVVPIKPLFKEFGRLLDDRDQGIRNETKNLIVEVYRWIGVTTKDLLKDIKPVVMTELCELFNSIPPEKPVRLRYLRSQKPKEITSDTGTENGPSDGAIPGETLTDQVDLDDMITPVEVLCKIPNDYWQKIGEKKWQDRRDALEAVEKITNVPRIVPGDFTDLVKSLIQVVNKDTNIILVTLAAKILGQIARGLKSKFSPYSQQTLQACLGKFKEKKPNVVQALRESADGAISSTSLDHFVDDIVAALGHKTPNVRAEAALILSRAFKKCSTTSLNKKILKSFTVPLCVTCNDTDPEVRECSFAALGAAMFVVSAKTIQPFLSELDSIRLAKINECCEQIASELSNSNNSGNQPTATSISISTSAKPNTAPRRAAPPVTRPNTAPSGTGQATSECATKTPTLGPSSKKSTARTKSVVEKSKSTIPTENLLTEDEISQKASELLGEALIKQLSDTNWKERLQAVEQMKSNIHSFISSDVPVQILCRAVLLKPGIKDTNFQVLRARIEYINEVLSLSISISSNLAELLLPDLIDKVGDTKVGDVTKTAMTKLAEKTSLELVGGFVMRTLFQIKNPRSQTEGLVWLNQSILEFGFCIPAQEVGPLLKAGLNATNPSVRQSSLNLAGTIHLYLNDRLVTLLADEKPALITLLNAEFAKNKDKKAPAPIRFSAAQNLLKDSVSTEPSGTGTLSGDIETTGQIEEMDSDALLPKVDISDRFTPELLGLLKSKIWKERLEALTTIEKFVTPSNLIDASNGKLQEPLTMIAKAANDVNKNLAKQALIILSSFASSMPKSDAVNYIKYVEPPILLCLGDSKVQIREAAVTALSSWQSRVPILSVFENDMLADALKMENPFLRAELLRWLQEVLSPMPLNALRKNASEITENLIPQVFASLEDRNVEARKQAQIVLPSLIQVFGWEPILKSANRLKPTSKDSIIPHLEKARESVANSHPSSMEKKTVSPPKAVRGGNGTRPQPSSNAPENSEESENATQSSDITSKPVSETKKKTDTKKSINTSKKSGPELATTSIILPPNKSAKSSRLNDEKKRKLLKWDFDTPTKDHIQQLSTLFIAAGTAPEFHALLFHTDFKQHIKAIEQLSQLLDTTEGCEATVINVDIILRWIVLRFFETNPVVLGRCMDYLTKLFVYMSESGANLSEHEGGSFLPYLVMKVGEPKDVVRQNIRGILKLVVNLYPPSRLFTFLTNGTKAKTSKTRQECLDEMGSLIDRFGLNVCQPSIPIAIKLIAQQIGDRDSGVRSAALNALLSAYAVIGEQIWKVIGDIPEKERSMLEERIKRAGQAPINTVDNFEPKTPSVRPSTARRDPSDSRKPLEPVPNEFRRQQPVSAAHARARAMLNELGDLSPEKAPSMPPLIQLDADINDLFQPVEIPALKTHVRQPVLNALLRTSPDTASAITMVVTAISSNDLLISCHALAEIDTVLRDEKWYLLLNHVNQVLMLITMQLRQVTSRYFGDPSVSEEQLHTLIRSHLATIESLFSRPTLGREASRETLRELSQSLLQMMLDERTSEMSSGENVIRSINALFVLILEASNGTRILSALIRLLHECVSNGHFTNRFTQAILKSIWRITKGMNTAFNNYSVDVILLDCHHFLKAFPPSSWSARKSDVPLRTIKTLLHVLCGLQGPSILQFLESIPNKEDSELESYLIRTLKTTSGVTTTTSDPKKILASENHLKGFVLSTVTREKLTEIFKKVGSKKPDEGLNELYDFTQLYPDVDLSSYLTNTSQFFQAYIKQALRNIAVERARQARLSVNDKEPNTLAAHQTDGVLARPNWNSDFDANIINGQPTDPKVFMNRLAVLRRELGLGGVSTTNMDDNIGSSDEAGIQNTAFETTLRNMVQPNGDSPDENTQPETEQRPTMSTTELMDLKRRLERIKSAQKH